MTLNDLILAGISALFGGGGGAALMRARGQNRTDATLALNSGQVAFNQALAQRVKDLEAAQAIQDERYDKMVATNAHLMANIQIYDAKFEFQAARLADLTNKLTVLGLENEVLRRENAELKNRVAQLERQIEGHHG